MDHIDRAIINEIQSKFPIVSRPYLELAGRVGCTEAEVFERITRLKEKGIIRRIGGNFHSGRLNFASTLCAARVPGEKIDLFVEVVNRYKGVTHNYLRKHDYNVWFTFVAPDMKDIELALKDISGATGVVEIYNLPALKMFKVKVDFQV